MVRVSTSQLVPEYGPKPEINDGSYAPNNIINFSFLGQHSDQDKSIFMSIQEQDLRNICFFLMTSISILSGMTYKVYDTLEGKQVADPQQSISRASVRFNEFAIYRYWKAPEDMHFPYGLTHLVAHRWSQPYMLDTDVDAIDGAKLQQTIPMVSTLFMQEGLAIAVDDMLFNMQLKEQRAKKFIDDFCRERIDEMPDSLENAINLHGFRSSPNEIVIPFSASLSKFLIRKYGVNLYKAAYVAIKEVFSPKENVRIIENVFQETESTILFSWKRSLGVV